MGTVRAAESRPVQLEGLRTASNEPYVLKHDVRLDLPAVIEVAARHTGAVEAHRATIPLLHPSGRRVGLDDAPATVIAGLAENNSWVTLFGVENDPALRPLATTIRERLAVAGRSDVKVILSLVCSSAHGVTPAHIDATEVLLLQLIGSKTFSTGYIPSRQRFAAELRRRFVDEENMDALPEVYTDWELGPGVGAFLPAYTPHWAMVGPEVSVALSVTIRSPSLNHREAIHAADATLLKRGLRLPAPGRIPALDEARLSAVSTARRLRAAARRAAGRG